MDLVMFSHLKQDLVYALRGLRQSPLFTTVAVLSLAVGIGANTAIFTLLDRLLLRPLPLPEPFELVQLDLPGPKSGMNFGDRTFSYPLYRDLRDQAKFADGIVAQFPFQGSLSMGDRSELVNVSLVSGNWFQTLGVAMKLGRPILPEDDVTPDAHPVIVVSHGLWQSRFGSDPQIVNKTVVLNGQRMTILGVAQAGFGGTNVANPVDVFLPMQMTRLLIPNAFGGMQSRRLHYLNVFARLQDGVGKEALKSDLDRAVAPILQEELKEMRLNNPKREKEFLARRFRIHSASNGNLDSRERVEMAMLLLSALVGGVLLIACANVANLLLARATARKKEIAVRLALGANRWQLIRLVLVESMVLAIFGGLLGLLTAHWAVDAILAYITPSGGRSWNIDGGPDWRVMLFTSGLSIVTGFVFGLAPALAASKPDVAPALKDEATNLAGSGATAWVRKGLVVLQVALSLLLLCAASLSLTSLHNLRHVDTGFDAGQLVSFRIEPAMNGYKKEQAMTLVNRLEEELRALPAVSSVTMAAFPMMADTTAQMTVRVEGYQPGPDEDMNPAVNEVGTTFFETMRIPLLMGRMFEQGDTATAPKVAVVSESFAKMYFKEGNPVGRHIGFFRTGTTDIRIVGVVRDVKQGTPRDSGRLRQVFIPSDQAGSISSRTYYLRTSMPLPSMAPGIRNTLRKLDPNVAIDDMRTMQEQIDVILSLERVITVLCSAFGVIATLLAAIGLYGVMAFHVARRTREIGLRMALGAQGGDVLRQVFRESGLLVLIGLLLGIPAALAMGELSRDLLFGVAPRDPGTIAMTALFLLGVAMVATLVPAYRASRIDPLRALRYE